MEKKDKMIIGGLIVVIIALIVGLAFMLSGNNLSNGAGSAPEGMKIYDFNSEFKMAVPNDAKFLKQWNGSGDIFSSKGYSYFDKDNEIVVAHSYSPLITHELVDEFIKIGNSSGNVTFDFEGDLIIGHNIKNDGEVGNTMDESNFKETILLQKGHEVVVVSGNDLDLIKSMINTIEFYEWGLKTWRNGLDYY